MARKVLVQYSERARRDLLELDQKLSVRIVKKISTFAHCGDPLRNAKALSGSLEGRYRYRIGDYRVIFRLDDGGRLNILSVLAIKHRKDVYR